MMLVAAELGTWDMGPGQISMCQWLFLLERSIGVYSQNALKLLIAMDPKHPLP